jgi:predicted hydrolase (HD superfamily)
LSGLITAAALVRPDKLNGLTTKSVMKKFREKSFAAGVSREQVAGCQQIGLELEEFIGVGIEAMQGIASDLQL